MSTRVVAITGAPGVGKTSVGALLGRLLPGPTVTLDTDALADVWPWEENDALLDLMAANLVTALPRAVAWGARTVVVSGVLLPGRLIERLGPVLEHPTLDWGWYALRGRPEALAARIAGFEGVHDPVLRASMSHLDGLLDALPDAVHIRTDDLALSDVVERIVAAERDRAIRVRPSHPTTAGVVTDDLRRWSYAALARRGVPADASATLVERLLTADAAGAASHGILRILEYCKALDTGEINAAARPVVERKSATWHVEGNGAGGWHTVDTVTRLLDDASEPVRVVRVSRGGHLGRLGDLVRPAAAAGRIVLGFATFSGTGQKVAACGTAEGSLGTNPVVLGFPAHGRPVVVDVSTSAWSEGAVRAAAQRGHAVPEGVLVSPDGRWSFDPAALYASEPRERAALVGLGRRDTGADSHKGFALGVLVELLGGATGGGLVCDAPAPNGRGGNSALFLSIAPDHLGHTDDGLRDLAERLEAHLAGRRPLDPLRPVRLPGRDTVAAVPRTLDLPEGVIAGLQECANGG